MSEMWRDIIIGLLAVAAIATSLLLALMHAQDDND